MNRILLLLLAVIFSLAARNTLAQTVSSVAPTQTGSSIRIDYVISGVQYNQTLKVEVFISNDGGATFEGPLKKVKGDVGEISGGGSKAIQWNAFEDDFDFSGNLVFDVRVEIYEDAIESKFLIGFTGNTAAPIGLMIGGAGKIAWYLSARLNTDYFIESQYTTDGALVTDYDGRGYYEFTGNSFTPRASFTGGLGFRLAKDVMYLYVGGGYGSKILLWETEDFSYESNTPQATEYAEYPEFSYAGYEVESGFLFSFNKVFFTLGASSVQLKRVDATFGLGISF